MNNADEQTISWDMMIHPDMKAIAERDVFLSDENGQKLQEMIDQIHLIEEILNKNIISIEATIVSERK